MRARLFATGLLVAVVSAAHVASAANAQQPSTSATAKAEEFSALAANISNVGEPGITQLTIKVDRWSTQEEHDRLFAALRDKGQDAFLKELTDGKRVGWVAPPTSLRYDFFYARWDPVEKGGRRIMMITDRPMQISERLYATPSRDYPFTVVELLLDKDGKGTGSLAQLVRLRLLGDVMGIENLASAPIQLNQVRKVK